MILNIQIDLQIKFIKLLEQKMKSLQQMSETQRIKSIFKKQYEYRSLIEHKKVLGFLEPYFSTLSTNTIKMISFFLQFVQKNENNDPSDDRKFQNGILITVAQVQQKQQQGLRNPQASYSYNIIKNGKINFTQKDNFGLYIAYDNYLSCLNLGQSTIQEELQFFNSSQYLCSMPKKKYFTILRNSKVLSFTYRQMIYSQGQLIMPGQSGSGVYLLRIGQMAYVKKIKDKSIEVFKFGPGHLLGTLESQGNQTKRLFGVKCKTGRVVVYHMSFQFFTLFLKPYCQSILVKKQKKLEKFLSQKSTQIQTFRQKHQQFNISLRKSYSHADEVKNRSSKGTTTVHMFTSRELPSLIRTQRKSQQIEKDQLRKTSYFQLRYEGPLKNYSKVIQKSKFMQSQFKDLDKLKEKNQKISKIRTIKNIISNETRQSIMFNLFQNSWKFQKERKKRNL